MRKSTFDHKKINKNRREELHEILSGNRKLIACVLNKDLLDPIMSLNAIYKISFYLFFKNI